MFTSENIQDKRVTAASGILRIRFLIDLLRQLVTQAVAGTVEVIVGIIENGRRGAHAFFIGVRLIKGNS